MLLTTCQGPSLTMASEIDQTCIMCARKAEKRCAKCREAAYCSLDRQKLDWGNHKLLCASWNTFITSPTTQSKRGLFFPGEDEQPHFVWLETKVDANGLYEFFDFKPLFGVDRSDIGKESTMRKLIQGRDTSRDGEEFHQMWFLEEATLAPPNNSLAKFTRAAS
jgi:hypothetical protein